MLAANVLLPDGTVAAVQGLQSAPHYNGVLAKVRNPQGCMLDT